MERNDGPFSTFPVGHAHPRCVNGAETHPRVRVKPKEGVNTVSHRVSDTGIS